MPVILFYTTIQWRWTTAERRTDFDHRTTVYDLSVDGLHNYFAGGVLVHNY